jgi:ABC-2 type transport system permease protein
VILVVLMALAGLASVHSASGPIRSAASATTDVPSIFLYLFTLAPDRVPAFHEFLGILGPLLGIAFGFDAVNGERSQRTLPRLVAQPITRRGDQRQVRRRNRRHLTRPRRRDGDRGGLRHAATRIGPTTSDFVRMIAFFVVAVVYIALWLALAIALSVVTRRAATAAFRGDCDLVGLHDVRRIDRRPGGRHRPPVPSANPTPEVVLANARLELNVRRISPSQLYQEATGVLLNPARQTTGLVVDEDPTTSQALPSTLSLSESLVLAWWQVSVLVGAVVVLFAGAYAIFMRQEVRA